MGRLDVRHLLLMLGPILLICWGLANWSIGSRVGTRAPLYVDGTFDSHTEARVREYLLPNISKGNKRAIQVWKEEFLMRSTSRTFLGWIISVLKIAFFALLPALVIIRVIQGKGGSVFSNTLLLGLLCGLLVRVGSSTRLEAAERVYNQRALEAHVPIQEMLRICKWHRYSYELIQVQIPVSHLQTIGGGTRWQAAYRAAKKEGPLDPERALFSLTILLSTIFLLLWLRKKWVGRKQRA